MKTDAAIVTTLMVLISSTAFAQEPVKVKPPANKLLTTENGRYIFGQISEMRRDQYMLDTKTGKLWNIVVATVGDGESKQEVMILQPVLYKHQDGKWFPEPDDLTH